MSKTAATKSGSPSPPIRGWTFLTNHAHVLFCLARDPDTRVRDVAVWVGITERAVQRILSELVEEGFVTTLKEGRRNHYTVNEKATLRHPLEKSHTVGELLNTLQPTAE